MRQVPPEAAVSRDRLPVPGLSAALPEILLLCVPDPTTPALGQQGLDAFGGALLIGIEHDIRVKRRLVRGRDSGEPG